MAGSVIGMQIVGNRGRHRSPTSSAARRPPRATSFPATPVRAFILSEDTITGNVIQGNYIGTNAAGTAAVGNGDWH